MSFKSKNFLLLFTTAIVASFTLSSCKDDEVIVENVQTITGNITEDITWTADTDYTLSGRVIVTDGATLTIEPGTIVKAEDQPNDEASVLIIATDGKIQANGTATAPIIFTSIADNITTGQVVGSNLGEADNGLWGGVIILGLAPISPESGTIERVEGIPASVDEAIYGGDEDTHSSGRFTYVSIRHAGIALAPDKEINGLTLGGVGSATVINNIEIVSNFDDGIEIFGGTVDVNNVAVLYQGDDGFDIDQAYSGKLENILYIGSELNDSDNALEIDGPEGSENADGAFIIRKGSLTGFSDDYAELKTNAQGNVENLYLFGFPDGMNVKILGIVANTNFQSGALSVTGCAFNDARTLADICTTDVVDLEATIDGIFVASAGNAVTTSPAVGADLSAFTGWTYADAKGALSVFE